MLSALPPRRIDKGGIGYAVAVRQLADAMRNNVLDGLTGDEGDDVGSELRTELSQSAFVVLGVHLSDQRIADQRGIHLLRRALPD